MKIADAKVIVCSPGRNFVTLKLTTEDGLIGLGDATLNGREWAVAGYLSEHVLPLLIGRDARRIEDTWQLLAKGVYWRGGPVTMTAIGAVDLALWDLRGKALGVPVYQLLGGASREFITVYGHATGVDVASTTTAVARFVDQGYTAVRAQCAVPGIPTTYGITPGQATYEPAQRGALPAEEVWSSERYLAFAPQLFAELRRNFGPEIKLLHDVHHRLTPIEAARLGRDLEPHRLFWMEDAAPAERQEAFRLIRQHTTTPLAVGEIFNRITDCHTLIEENLIDFIRMAPTHAGGLTPLVKVAHLAELHQVRTACHGPSDLSPLCMSAALHFGLSVHNFGLQEFMGYPDLALTVFKPTWKKDGGRMHPGDAPGLGVAFDEAEAARHPYQRAYLPINRKEDGTLHDW